MFIEYDGYAKHPWKEAHLAPEGRHVYSNRTIKFPKAPEGRHVCFRSRGVICL